MSKRTHWPCRRRQRQRDPLPLGQSGWKSDAEILAEIARLVPLRTLELRRMWAKVRKRAALEKRLEL